MTERRAGRSSEQCEEPEVGSREWRDKHAGIQGALNACLDDLATQRTRTPEEVAQVVDALNDVYGHKDFRHRYSEIIEVVHRYDDDEKLDVAAKASMAMSRGDTLASSLRVFLVHDCKQEGCGPDCAVHRLQQQPGFMKLYDHANLEAKRAGYDYARANSIISEIREAQTDLERANRRVIDAKEKAEEALSQAKRLQTETVSVLGVFSAIILAFNASITFSTSSIAAVDATPPFNVAFIVAIIGLMLFNCLYGAFALIYRIIRPEKSPDSLLRAGMVAGIELCAVSCALFLGTLTYFNGRDASPWEILPLGIAVCVLLIGIYLVSSSGEQRGRS